MSQPSRGTRLATRCVLLVTVSWILIGCGDDDGPAALIADALTVTVDEDGAATDSVTGTDPDGGTIAFEVVTSPAHAQGTFTIDPATGAFTYTPVADYNGADEFTFHVTGTGGRVSAEATVTITVTAVNDAPVLDDTQLPVLPSIEEDDTTSVGDAVADIVVDGSVTDADGTAVEAVAVTAVDDANGTWEFSTDGGATWTAFGAVSDAAAMLLDAGDSARFVPDADWTGNATITFRAWDETSGTAGATADTSVNGGTTAFSAATDTATLSVTAANDAPVLDDAQSPAFSAIIEDETTSPGDLVANVVVNGSITDPDGAVESIAITAVDETLGIFEYSTDDGTTWSAVSPVTESAALLLDGTATGASANLLRFVPSADRYGTASLTFRAWDMSDGGTAGTTGNATLTGGIEAFSVASDTAEIQIAPVNDEPSFTPGADQSLPWDSGAQAVAGWATGVLPGGIGEDAQVVTFEIVSNSNPTIFDALGLPAVSTAGELTFTPSGSASGSATIEIRALDDGGTADGGDDTGATETFTITLTNTAPAAAAQGYNATGNTQVTVAAPAGLVTLNYPAGTDADGDAVALAAPGTIATTQGGQVTTNADGSFTYTPPRGFEGTDTFDYSLADGADASPAATVTLTVGTVVWYVDSAAAAGGDGTSVQPYDSIAALNAVNGAAGAGDPETGDTIFIYEGSGAYADGIVLLDGQTLLGEAVGLAVEGLTVPAGNAPLIAPTGDGINVATDNTVRGVISDVTDGYAMIGGGVGDLVVSDSYFASTGTGGGINVTGLGSGGNLDLIDVTASGSPSYGMRIEYAESGGDVDVTGTLDVSGATLAGVYVDAHNTLILVDLGSPNINVVGTAVGVEFTDVMNAAVNIAGGTITSTGSGGALVYSGGGSMACAADIVNSAGRAVTITNNGDNITISGNVTCSGDGILISGGSPGHIDFDTASTVRLDGGGIDVTGRGGGDIDFHCTFASGGVAGRLDAPVSVTGNSGGNVQFISSVTMGSQSTPLAGDALTYTGNTGGRLYLYSPSVWATGGSALVASGGGQVYFNLGTVRAIGAPGVDATGLTGTVQSASNLQVLAIGAKAVAGVTANVDTGDELSIFFATHGSTASGSGTQADPYSLFSAVAGGGLDPDVVLFLLDTGSDIDITDSGSNTLTLSANQRLVGFGGANGAEGSGSTVTLKGINDIMSFDVTDTGGNGRAVVLGTGSPMIQLADDCVVQGVGLYASGSESVTASGTTSATVLNVVASSINPGGSGGVIDLSDVGTVSVSGCRIEDAKSRSGIVISNSAGGAATTIDVSDCHVSGLGATTSTQYGIDVTISASPGAGTVVQATNNTLVDLWGTAIRVTATGSSLVDAQIQDNAIADPMQAGILIDHNSSDHLWFDFAGNTITGGPIGTGAEGIYLRSDTTTAGATLQGQLGGWWSDTETVSGMGGDGLAILAQDAAEITVAMDSGSITGGQSDAIYARATDTSSINLRVTNSTLAPNNLSGSYVGLTVEALLNATVGFHATSNTIAPDDIEFYNYNATSVINVGQGPDAAGLEAAQSSIGSVIESGVGPINYSQTIPPPWKLF